MNEVVDTMMKKQAFGMPSYNLPSNEMLMKKIQFGKSAKEKGASFIE